MKILISDYPDSMMPDHQYEIDILSAGLPTAEIAIFAYQDENRSDFLHQLADVDVLLTGFIKIDAEVLQHAPQLKLISINATGYDNVDLVTATQRCVAVCPVGEYCTHDVAEHTLALMLALNKNLKSYTYEIEQLHQWKYDLPLIPQRIEAQILGIFGLGKIGKRVAKLAQGMGMSVIACDPMLSATEAAELGVECVSQDDIFARADVITNHMNLGANNVAYFTAKEFAKMKNSPLFLNLGRGLSVNEVDLADALDRHLIRGAGLDVLQDETPDLKTHILTQRDNVIITPHAAFYSLQSMTELQRISCENIVHFILGQKDKVFRLVNTF